MAKGRPLYTEEFIATRIKEGYGFGKGKFYKPFISIQNVPSLGRSARSPSWINERKQDFLSDHETRYNYILHWSDIVIDVREQFPLYDRERAQKIAEKLNIEYPKKNGIPVVLTTDFMITIILDEKIKYIARTIKLPEDLDDDRTIEKFEIEKIYYEEINIDWAIVEETPSSKILATNIENIFTSYWIYELPIKDKNHLLNMLMILKNRLQIEFGPVQFVIDLLDSEYSMEKGTFLALYWHLVARKQIKMNMYGNMDLMKITTDQITIIKEKQVLEDLA